MATPALNCYCDRCRFFNVCGGCHKACSRALCARPCSSCDVRCVRRRDAADWVWDAGGSLELTVSVRWPGVQGDWPPIVPEVDGSRMAEYDAVMSWSAYAVGPVHAHVLTALGDAVSPGWRSRRAREKLGLPERKKILLHLFGPDELLESLWRHQHANRVWEEIAALEFDLVLGPNFSVYGEHPRFEHLLNMRRSLVAAARLAAFGVPVAPNVYWWTWQDLTRWASAVEAMNISAVAVNAQTYRTERDWAFLLAGLKYLGERLGERVLVFVNGVARPARVAAVRKALPRVVFVSRAVQLRAQRGALLSGERANGPAPELFRQNLREFLGWLRKPLDM